MMVTEQFSKGPRETYIIIRTQVLFKVLIFWPKLDNILYRPNSRLNRCNDNYVQIKQKYSTTNAEDKHQ